MRALEGRAIDDEAGVHAVGGDQRDDLTGAARRAAPLLADRHGAAAREEARRHGYAGRRDNRLGHFWDAVLERVADGEADGVRLRAAERRAHRVHGRRSSGALVFAAPRDRAGVIRGNCQDRVFANFNSENHGVSGIVSPGQSTCTCTFRPTNGTVLALSEG